MTPEDFLKCKCGGTYHLCPADWPWNPDYWICDKCESTYIYEEYPIEIVELEMGSIRPLRFIASNTPDCPECKRKTELYLKQDGFHYVCNDCDIESQPSMKEAPK